MALDTRVTQISTTVLSTSLTSRITQLAATTLCTSLTTRVTQLSAATLTTTGIARRPKSTRLPPHMFVRRGPILPPRIEL